MRDLGLVLGSLERLRSLVKEAEELNRIPVDVLEDLSAIQAALRETGAGESEIAEAAQLYGVGLTLPVELKT